MDIVNSLPEDKWRKFVEEHNDGNIFHTPEMFQVFRNTKDYTPELWAAVDDDNRILALLLPVNIHYYRYLPHFITSRSVVFGGVLSIPGEKGLEGLDNLLRAYQQNTKYSSVLTEIRNISPLGESAQVLHKHGFLYEDHLNYLININCSPEEIFNRIGNRTRKNIRHGLNSNRVIIEEINTKAQLSSCYRILERVYRNVKVPLADLSLFNAAYDLLCPLGKFRITIAKVEQIPIAVSMELLYKDIIYGWYGGLDRTFSTFVPNELLMWHILEWGAKNGYRIYDFGGAGKPNEKYGVRDFKAKFGGNLVCYGRNVCIHKPILFKLSKIGYSIYRRFL